MANQSHRYDHPAYLARMVMSLGHTAAGANGTNSQAEFDHDIQIRNVVARATVAGTTATNTLTVRADTTSIGLLTLANSAAGFVASSGDLNVTLTSGTAFNLLKGTDATGTAAITMSYHIPYNTAIPV